jgi:SAM-dependent methyltransferase
MDKLTEIMNRHGSDKGSGHHNYTEYYNQLFTPIKENKLTVLEIGIGTMNPYIPSSMIGTPGGYFPGASLRGWEEYFTNSDIYGCDIDKDILFNTNRIKTFYLDQTNQQSLQQNICSIDREYDIIIDDGLHHFETNWKVLKTIYKKLKHGGIYIVEDLVDFSPEVFYNDQFRFDIIDSGDTCDYICIPNPKNTVDNNLIVLTKYS